MCQYDRKESITTLLKKSKFKRSLAFIAALTMILTMLPAEMFSVIALETPSSEAYVLNEEIEMRKSDEKHFVMSDGTMMAVKYNEQITGILKINNRGENSI